MTAAIRVFQQALIAPNKIPFRGLVFKAIRKDGLWVITALVRGQVEEFAGRRLIDATTLLARELARTPTITHPQEQVA